MKKPSIEPFISSISVSNEDRKQLQQLQQSLGLKEKVINIIEAQVTSSYEQKLKQYEEAFNRAIHQQYPLGDEERQQLLKLQESLEIREEVRKKIVAKVTQVYEQKLKQYEEEFTKAIHQQYPLNQDSCNELQLLQQKLGLSNEIVAVIEIRNTAPIQAERQRKSQQYEKAFTRAIQRQPLSDDERKVLEPLSDDEREVLENYQQVLNLSKEITQAIEEKVTQAYEQKLQQYEEAFTGAIHQQYPLSDEERQPLQLLQQSLELRNEIAESIAAKVTSSYEQKLQQYEKALTWASQRQYPFSDEDREFLEYRRQQLNLSNNIADSIEAKITETYKRTLPERKEPVAPSSEQLSLPNNVIRPPLPTKPEGKYKENLRRLRLGATVVAALLSVGAIACYAYIEKSAEAALWRTKTLTERKKYEECANQASLVPQISLFYSDAQYIVNKCQRLAQDEKWLAQAQELAKTSNFKDAIAIANKIQADQSLRASAAHLIAQWSENILKQAEARYKEAHDLQELRNVIDITTAIPKTSSVAKKAEEMKQKWQTEWHKNETYLQAAQNASLKGNWREAIDQVNQIRILGQEVKRDNLYWQNNLKPIIEEAEQRLAGTNGQSSRVGAKLVGPRIVGTRPNRIRNASPRIVGTRPNRIRNASPRNNARRGGFRQENR